ncbi:MAG TPA: hypothetical protein HPP80_07515 [Rhodospirillaceae bacterium]|nr:hypothetical protein [Rhodospirillaceae bacterium]
MKLLRHERIALAFLVRHLVVGVVGGVVFGGLILYYDIAHLRSLATQSSSGFLTLGLLFFGLVVTFGSLGMGVGIMSQGNEEN